MVAGVEISTHVQSLPQELFDYLYALVLTPSKATKIINAGYKPPAQLQMDRKSRALFADAYYRETPFRLDCNIGEKWLAIIPEEHFRMLERITLDGSLRCGSEDGDSLYWAGCEFRQQHERFTEIALSNVGRDRKDRVDVGREIKLFYQGLKRSGAWEVTEVEGGKVMVKRHMSLAAERNRTVRARFVWPARVS